MRDIEPDGPHSEPTVIASFPASVWVPGRPFRARGLFPASLSVLRHLVMVRPNFPGLRFMGESATTKLDYTWPAIVIERFKPIGNAGVLVDIGGQLGRVTVLLRRSHRLHDALVSGGFLVAVIERVGWERPRPAIQEELGELVDKVPRCTWQ